MQSNDMSLAAWQKVKRALVATGVGSGSLIFESYAKEWGEAVTLLAQTQAAGKPDNKIVDIEYDLWLYLLNHMIEIGAVTGLDCNLKREQGAPTPGARLLRALEDWGKHRYAIGGGDPKHWP